MIFGYGRVSTGNQNTSLDAQDERVREFCEQFGERFAGMYLDDAESGYTTDLKDRPKGRLIWERLQPGDMIVASSQDRMFRNVRFAAPTWEQLACLGVRVYFLDSGEADLTSRRSRQHMNLRALFDEDASIAASEKAKRGWDEAEKHGRPCGPSRAYGWAIQDGQYVLTKEAQQERKLAAKVVELRNAGKTWRQIYWHFRLAGWKKPICRPGSMGWYCTKSLIRLRRAHLDGFPKLARVEKRAACCASKQSADSPTHSRPENEESCPRGTA